MKPKKKNAGFSLHPAMVPRRTKVTAHRRARKASHRSSPLMGARMSQAERLKEDRLLREIAKLGRRERNVAKKKKSRKRRQPTALARYWAKRRKKKNARRPKPVARRRQPSVKRRRRAPKPVRRRNAGRKSLRLNLSLSPKQKRTLASFLSRATGRRVKVQ
jgi:hypothetical protein